MTSPIIPPPLPPLPRIAADRRLTYKLLTIAGLLLGLQVPLLMIDATRDERANRHAEAVKEVTAAWGGEQRVAGPFLVVPCLWDRGEGKAATRHELRLAPATLTVDGTLAPRELTRGIYRTNVFTAALHLVGTFDFSKLTDARLTPIWEEARLVCAVTDARGLRSAQVMRWQGEALDVEGGTGITNWETGLQAKVTVRVDRARPADFELNLSLDGSGGLWVAPVARETRVTLAATGTAPSFAGAFLPGERSVTEDGFAATWEVGALGRDLPERWFGGADSDGGVVERIKANQFGVALAAGVDDYRTIERSIKYGALFLVTLFAGFFAFEMVGRRTLHGLNYLLMGGAICLFYLALLALSEFVRFGWAYAGAAGASAGLIGLYTRAVLRDGRGAAIVSGLLGGIFGYLYLVLQLEDLSLVAGTVLLFGLLGITMYVTRNLRPAGEEGGA